MLDCYENVRFYNFYQIVVIFIQKAKINYSFLNIPDIHICRNKKFSYFKKWNFSIVACILGWFQNISVLFFMSLVISMGFLCSYERMLKNEPHSVLSSEDHIGKKLI